MTAVLNLPITMCGVVVFIVVTVIKPHMIMDRFRTAIMAVQEVLENSSWVDNCANNGMF